jgi:soluble lytic murein transglycosylase-like protein
MATLSALFLSVSSLFSLPPGYLSALCFVESHHDHKAIHRQDGKSNSLGACQVKLATAQMLGFKGTEKELMKPEVNVYYAGAYLNRQIRRYDDIPLAIAAYNSGTLRVDAAGHIKNWIYVRKVFQAYVEGR